CEWPRADANPPPLAHDSNDEIAIYPSLKPRCAWKPGAPGFLSRCAMSASKFLANFFAASTGSVYACSLPNERDVGTPAEICGRGDWTRLDDLVGQWDRPGRGTFFCVNTIMPRQARRAKETVAEIVALHADVDFDKISATPQEAETKLSQLLLLPSYLVASGNGLHAYWLLREAAAATPEAIAQAEHLLRLLAGHIGGGRARGEVARPLRLPGSPHHQRHEAPRGPLPARSEGPLGPREPGAPPT